MAVHTLQTIPVKLLKKLDNWNSYHGQYIEKSDGAD